MLSDGEQKVVALMEALETAVADAKRRRIRKSPRSCALRGACELHHGTYCYDSDNHRHIWSGTSGCVSGDTGTPQDAKGE